MNNATKIGLTVAMLAIGLLAVADTGSALMIQQAPPPCTVSGSGGEVVTVTTNPPSATVNQNGQVTVTC